MQIPEKSLLISLTISLSKKILSIRALSKVKLMTCVFFFLVLVLALCSTRISCQEVEDEREFTYVQGSEKCKTTRGLQSPIDLSDERVDVGMHLKELKRSYRPTNATIINTGHIIMLRWVGGAGTIQINDTEYVLQQCHWHSPSEHTFHGNKFALELHMVHQSADNKTAVVGITYMYGRPDTFLTALMEHIPPIVFTDNQERPVGAINPKDIKMGSEKYYRYVGSLTIPPCTQNIVWTIVQKVRTASREQVRLLRAAVRDDSKTNARPVQKINERSVHLYRPQDPEAN